MCRVIANLTLETGAMKQLVAKTSLGFVSERKWWGLLGSGLNQCANYSRLDRPVWREGEPTKRTGPSRGGTSAVPA